MSCFYFMIAITLLGQPFFYVDADYKKFHRITFAVPGRYKH